MDGRISAPYRTADFMRAAIYRALGARLLRMERKGARVVAILDLSTVGDGLAAGIEAMRAEHHAAQGHSGSEAVARLVDNTFLGLISGHMRDLKLQAAEV